MADFKSFVCDQLKGWTKSFKEDLAALPDSALTESFAGNARVPVDFAYEVAFVNRRIACRLRGEDPGPWPEGGWMTAPEEFRTREAITAEIEGAAEELVAAIEAYPEEKLWEKTGEGMMATVAASIHLAVLHTSYHDAQLNYIQELHGDMEMHWKD